MSKAKGVKVKEVEFTSVDDNEFSTREGLETNNNKHVSVVEDVQTNINITFCTHVKWDGVLILLFVLLIACLLLCLAIFIYNLSQAYVWLLIAFAVLYLLLIVKFLWSWRKLAKQITEELLETKKVSG